jgi:hypothetical protein
MNTITRSAIDSQGRELDTLPADHFYLGERKHVEALAGRRGTWYVVEGGEQVRWHDGPLHEVEADELNPYRAWPTQVTITYPGVGEWQVREDSEDGTVIISRHRSLVGAWDSARQAGRDFRRTFPTGYGVRYHITDQDGRELVSR